MTFHRSTILSGGLFNFQPHTGETWQEPTLGTGAADTAPAYAGPDRRVSGIADRRRELRAELASSHGRRRGDQCGMTCQCDQS